MAKSISEKNKIIQSVFTPVAAILFGLAVGALIMLAVGTDPLFAYKEMFGKSFLNPYYLGQTIVRSLPIMLSGVAAAVAWRAGYINLGMQGQMCVGGLCAALVALFFPVKAWWVTIICFAVGSIAGAIWALIPTFFDYKYNASLIITTLMLNYATNFLTDFFVTGPIKDTAGDGMAQQSPQIAECMRFFRFSNKNAMNTSVFLGIIVVILIHFFLKKSRFGYESKITGLNRSFADYGGIKSGKMMFTTMGLSGALCGFAACIEIFGARYRYIGAMFTSTGYSWTGLMAMLIAAYNLIMTLVYSILLSGLTIGGQALQRTVGLPMQISDIIQAVITVFVSVKVLIDFKWLFRDKKRPGPETGVAIGSETTGKSKEEVKK